MIESLETIRDRLDGTGRNRLNVVIESEGKGNCRVRDHESLDDLVIVEYLAWQVTSKVAMTGYLSRSNGGWVSIDAQSDKHRRTAQRPKRVKVSKPVEIAGQRSFDF